MGRAEHLPRLRELARAAADLGDAEVEHLDEVLVVAALDQLDVVGLQVAVDDADLVRGAERAAQLLGDVNRALGARMPLLLDRAA